MNFPHCNKCYANNVITSGWIAVEHKKTENGFISIYKCSMCSYEMSWSYINPDDNLKGDNTIPPILS